MALVEAARIDAVQPLHGRGEPHRFRLDQQVIVRAHQAVGDEPPAEPGGRDAERVQELQSVEVVVEDVHAAGTNRGEMKVPIGEVGPPHPRHLAITVARLRPGVGLCAPIGTELSLRSGPVGEPLNGHGIKR